MNKQKIMLSILKEINNFNVPTEKDYEIDIIQFNKMCKSLEAEGYICNLSSLKSYVDGSYDFSLQSAEITLTGIKYIDENKLLYKGYMGLKEIREWLRL